MSFLDHLTKTLKSFFHPGPRPRRGPQAKKRPQAKRKPLAKKKLPSKQKSPRPRVSGSVKSKEKSFAAKGRVAPNLAKKVSTKRPTGPRLKFKTGGNTKTKAVSTKNRAKKRISAKLNTVQRNKIGVNKKRVLPGQEKRSKAPLEADKLIRVGVITHYFSKIKVCVVKIEKKWLSKGDKIVIRGKNTNFEQIVQSMQVESVDVNQAKPGQLVGLKVEKAAQVGNEVYIKL